MRRQLPRILLLALLVPACREGEANVGFEPVPASAVGADGCNGANQAFGSVLEVYADAAVIGATSRLAASQTSDTLYLTGADGSVRALDVAADPTMPVLSSVLDPGVVDALLAGALTMPPAAELSGVAVLDPTNLVLVEHTSNTILIASLVNPNAVGFYVGFPETAPSFVDGVAGGARFGFPAGTPVDLVVTGDQRLFVADAGNHALREVLLGQLSTVGTAAGQGVPGGVDGSLSVTLFDGPTGVSVACTGELLVTEATGHRVRQVTLGSQTFFGGRNGLSRTLAGDGTDATVQGVDTMASVGGPVSPVSTMGGEVYWVDGSTGILRRHDLATGLTDCPLFADCDAANMAGGSFSGAGNYSLTVSMSGDLFVLDGAAGKLFLVQP